MTPETRAKFPYRTTAKDYAQAQGISVSAARARLNKLIENGEGYSIRGIIGQGARHYNSSARAKPAAVYGMLYFIAKKP